MMDAGGQTWERGRPAGVLIKARAESLLPNFSAIYRAHANLSGFAGYVGVSPTIIFYTPARTPALPCLAPLCGTHPVLQNDSPLRGDTMCLIKLYWV